ncbi:MAG: P-II family nitrogen regulator [Elusimicrobia bacterium]|nr:P-II family nitrogen regulator [Elusimicrobiota bacterium]
MATKKLHLVTAIVQHHLGGAVIDAALKGGATGATYYYAQGTGVRQTLGTAAENIEIGKRVVSILVAPVHTEKVLQAVIAAGEIDKPGGGVAYVQEVVQAVGFVAPKA